MFMGFNPFQNVRTEQRTGGANSGANSDVTSGGVTSDVFNDFNSGRRSNRSRQNSRRQQSNRSHRSNRSHQSHRSQVERVSNLVGRHIRVNRGGPDSIEGTLMAVLSEYWVLSSATGTIYVQSSHVKSITEGDKSQNASRSVRFIRTSSFRGLLNELRQNFVQINQGGPEKVEGFLAEVNADHLLLIVGREFVRVPLFHIKTISVTGSKSGSTSNGNKSNKNQSNKNQSNSHSGQSNHRSGKSGNSGGRSGSRGGSRGNRGGSGGRSR